MALVQFAVLSSQGAVTKPGAESFDKYQVILDRQPFSAPEPEKVPGPPSPPPEWTTQLRLCGITFSESAGLRVGIVDQKTQKSYYLRIGDEEDGILVVDADIRDEFAVVQKEGVEQRLNLNGTSAAAGSATAASATVPVRLSPDASRVVASVTASAPTRLESYADKLRRRREERERQAAAVPEVKLSPEELEKQLKEYQMKVIREGLPPLPIPLTKEMDDQLVKEGVLPPQESE
jgi:hypothetical protein